MGDGGGTEEKDISYRGVTMIHNVEIRYQGLFKQPQRVHYRI